MVNRNTGESCCCVSVSFLVFMGTKFFLFFFKVLCGNRNTGEPFCCVSLSFMVFMGMFFFLRNYVTTETLVSYVALCL